MDRILLYDLPPYAPAHALPCYSTLVLQVGIPCEGDVPTQGTNEARASVPIGVEAINRVITSENEAENSADDTHLSFCVAPYLVQPPNSVIAKVVSYPRMSIEKFTALEVLPEIIRRGEVEAYSYQNKFKTYRLGEINLTSASVQYGNDQVVASTRPPESSTSSLDMSIRDSAPKMQAENSQMAAPMQGASTGIADTSLQQSMGVLQNLWRGVNKYFVSGAYGTEQVARMQSKLHQFHSRPGWSRLLFCVIIPSRRMI